MTSFARETVALLVLALASRRTYLSQAHGDDYDAIQTAAVAEDLSLDEYGNIHEEPFNLVPERRQLLQPAAPSSSAVTPDATRYINDTASGEPDLAAAMRNTTVKHIVLHVFVNTTRALPSIDQDFQSITGGCKGDSAWDQPCEIAVAPFVVAPLFVVQNASTLTLTRLILRNGNATESGGKGGCLYLDQVATAYVYDSLFKFCSADVGGAIYTDVVATAHVYNSIFEFCSANKGGAIYTADDSRLVAYGSRFSSNAAVDGGFLYAKKSTNFLNNVKVADNTCTQE
eukprot:gene17794-21191_t